METTDKSQSESATVLEGPDEEATAPDEAGGGAAPEEERPAPARPRRRVPLDGFLAAPFPWYALDEAYTGPRRPTTSGRTPTAPSSTARSATATSRWSRPTSATPTAPASGSPWW